MQGLYIGSTSGFAGKNLIAMCMCIKFQQEGYRVGYMKPVGTIPGQYDNKRGDEDAFFVQDALGLREDIEVVSPVLVAHDFHTRILSEGRPDFISDIKNAYKILSKDKDVVLICGSGSFLYSGKYCNISGIDVSQILDAKVLLIDRYFKEFNYDYLISAKEMLDDHRLIGVILNGVPESRLSEVEAFIRPLLERRSIKVFGTIPEDTLLNAITIGDLASRLNGKIISVPEKKDKMVENFLIGTMQVENFMTYFRKKRNSALIVGGDRSDLQLVALEGKCPCLILTGNLYPNDIILSRSEVLEVPIIVVREDTYTIAKKMEKILETIKLRDTKKISHGTKLINSVMDWSSLKQELKLK